MQQGGSVGEAQLLGQTVDLERFPIHEPGSSAYSEAVDSCRAELRESGCTIIRSFFRPEAMKRVRAEALPLLAKAHVNNIKSNAYSTEDDQSLPAEHPVRIFMERTNAFVPRDHIPVDNALHRLYGSAIFKRFVADCVQEEEIHEYADPLAGLVLNLLKPGCQHPWHYDANEFIVSALVQEAEEGGLFEYCPGIRQPGDENYDAVRSVILDEDRSRVRALPIQVGDLQLFKGRFALHRVTRVQGPQPRVSSIFAYAKEPDFVSTVQRAEQLFGRATPLHYARSESRQSHDGLID